MPDMTPRELRQRAARDLAAADQLDGTTQYTDADLKNMTPEQIVAARRAGQFNDLFNTDPPKDAA